jgi:phage gp36-like protein
MTYASRSDMVRLYTEQVLILLTDQTGSGVVNETSLSGALASADAEINSYLAGRYAIPLATVPVGLNDKACVIARYLLDGQNDNDVVRNRYKDVISWLRDVQAGRANLGIDAAQKAEVLAGGANIQSDGRVFSRAGRF